MFWLSFASADEVPLQVAACVEPDFATRPQLVAANETLKLENADLLAVNEQLRAQLLEIGTTLGRLTGGPRRGRGRRGAEMAVLAEVKPERTRKPITDPAQIERRRAALAKARAARAEKLAAAREGSAR